MTSPTTPRDAIGLSERLRQMPSSLNDACRTMEEAATALDAIQARVEELEADNKYWKISAERAWLETKERNSRAKAAESRATSAEQERDEAYERLKPFAKAAAAYDPEDGEPGGIVDKDTLWGDDDLTVGHCRAARDLVRRLADGTEKEGE